MIINMKDALNLLITWNPSRLGVFARVNLKKMYFPNDPDSPSGGGCVWDA